MFLLMALLCAAPAIADEGFYLPADLPAGLRPAKLERALEATVLVENSASECSGSLITPQGHVLTALHCVLSDLRAAGVLKEIKTPGIRWLATTEQAPRALRLAGVSARVGAKQVEAHGAQVVLVGRGLLVPEGENFTVPPKEQVPFTPEDFVVLKFDFKTGDLPCVPLRVDHDFSAGATVWAIGFPGEARRASGRGSDGRSKYISRGRLFAGFSASPLMQGVAAEELARLDSFFLGPVMVLSNLDGYAGLSGGMVLDERGALAAVVSTGMSTDTDFVDVSATAVRADHILARAMAVRGPELVAEITSCK